MFSLRNNLLLKFAKFKKTNKMKFNSLILVVAVLSTFLFSCKSDEEVIGNWVSQAFFEGYARAEGSSFAINDYGYFGMGKDNDDYLSDFWKFDPTQGTLGAWTQVADFPGTPRAYNVSINNGTKGYIGLGYDGDNDLSDFWEYDPQTNSWAEIDSFGGGERRFATAFAINNDIYVGTGTQEKDKIYTSDFWKYDGSQWTKAPSFAGEKRKKANAVTLNGKAYIISGTHNGGALNDFWEFDPSTGVWTKLTLLDDETTGNSSVARYNAAAFASNGKIYLVGGVQNSSTLTSTFEWDPSTQTWTEKTSLEANGREGFGYFVLSDYGYIVGGHSGSYYFDDCYKFQPDADKVSND